MKRRTKIILIVCGVVVMGFIAGFIGNTWSLVPIKSSLHILTLVKYGGFYTSRITLRHYVSDVHISDYVLEVKNGVHVQEPQSYELPQLNEGMVEVNVELVNGIDKYNSNFTINYDKASDLHEKGLLIYTTEDYRSSSTIGNFVYYDQYVYFISAKDETCYFEKAGFSEWSVITNAPPLRKVKRNEPMPFISIYSGWKENEWIVLPANNNPDN